MDKTTIENHFRGNFRAFYEHYLPSLKKAGSDEMKAICPFHEDRDPSLSVNNQTGLFKCFGCDAGGDIYTFYAKTHDMTLPREFSKILAGIAEDFGIHNGNDKQTVKPTVVKRYDYRDESGGLVYQIERLEPKNFRIRRPDGKNEWIYKKDDARIVPYHLPEIMDATEIIVCEGEKDADKLTGIGFTATTNPLGAKKWPDDFGQYFKDKDVVLIPDNDAPGAEHMFQVAKNLQGHAASIKWLDLPGLKGKGDVSDFIATFPNKEAAAERLTMMIDGATPYEPPENGIKDVLKQEQQATDVQRAFLPLTPAETLVKGRLVQEPPQPEALIMYHDAPMLTRGCVGGIVAAGGTGKTYIMIQTGTMMARGGKLGPLSAPKPLKVLFLPAEDPQGELDLRLWRVCHGDFPDGFYAMSVSGKIGPLMELDNGNPARSEHFDWLCKTIENHAGLDVLMIDPKSRFYGLDENNNDHSTRWIACLEYLVIRYNITVLFSHHVSKGNGDSLHQNMSRGGSAIADGVRWLIGITSMNEQTAEKYGVNPRDYIEMDLVKANYVAKLPQTLFFKRDGLGVLHYEDLGMGRLNSMTQQMVILLREDKYELTRRELARTELGAATCAKMKEFFPKFTKCKDVDLCIDNGIQKGWVEEIDDGTKRNPRRVIRIKSIGA